MAAGVSVLSFRDAHGYSEIQVSWGTHDQLRVHIHAAWLVIVLVWAGIPLDSISLKTLTDLLCVCVNLCVRACMCLPSCSIEQVCGVCL